MKLLYAYSGSARRRRRQLGCTVDRVLNTRPAWSATKLCARLRTVTTVDSDPPQTVSTPAGEAAFLGASEAITSRSRDDDASMAWGFCLRSIMTALPHNYSLHHTSPEYRRMLRLHTGLALESTKGKGPQGLILESETPSNCTVGGNDTQLSPQTCFDRVTASRAVGACTRF